MQISHYRTYKRGSWFKNSIFLRFETGTELSSDMCKVPSLLYFRT